MVDEVAMASLVETAREASRCSHSPYSGFPVGAAVLLSDGSVHAGCNVENASYGATVCAERVAVFKAVAVLGGGISIEAVAIYTPTEDPVPPCGLCRQVISEFGPEAEVVSTCESDRVLRAGMRELLPHAFTRRDLGR